MKNMFHHFVSVLFKFKFLFINTSKKVKIYTINSPRKISQLFFLFYKIPTILATTIATVSPKPCPITKGIMLLTQWKK